MTTQRPPITRSLTASEFAGWYWLKSELILLCRLFGLRTMGSKLDLETRILGHLSGTDIAPKSTIRKTGEMPAVFTLQSVIGNGWRCNPALGSFFRQVCGKGFRFNAAMRDYIHNGAGNTLADAAIRYHASVQPGAPRRAILKQLEYNQHFRDYFAAHPGASRQEAIDAWWQKRATRNRTRQIAADQK